MTWTKEKTFQVPKPVRCENTLTVQWYSLRMIRTLRQKSTFSHLIANSPSGLTLFWNEMPIFLVSYWCIKMYKTCKAFAGVLCVKVAADRPTVRHASHYSPCVISLQSAHYLHEEAARYPRKIHYHNPPDLAMEALEVCSEIELICTSLFKSLELVLFWWFWKKCFLLTEVAFIWSKIKWNSNIVKYYNWKFECSINVFYCNLFLWSKLKHYPNLQCHIILQKSF